MKKLFAFCIGVGLGWPAVAGAEVLDFGQPLPQRARTKVVGPAEAPPKKIIFGEEDPVVGELRDGEGDLLRLRDRSRFRGLIKVRSSFVPEMLKSAENF